MISTAADLDRFTTALFRGRLLPPAQQKLVFTVPQVDSAPTNTNSSTTRAASASAV